MARPQIDQPAESGGAIDEECVGRGVAVDEPPGQRGRLEPLPFREGVRDHRTDPGSDPEMLGLGIQPWKSFARCDLQTRDRGVRPRQCCADEPLLRFVGSGQPDAVDERQQRQGATVAGDD